MSANERRTYAVAVLGAAATSWRGFCMRKRHDNRQWRKFGVKRRTLTLFSLWVYASGFGLLPQLPSILLIIAFDFSLSHDHSVYNKYAFPVFRIIMSISVRLMVLTFPPIMSIAFIGNMLFLVFQNIMPIFVRLLDFDLFMLIIFLLILCS